MINPIRLWQQWRARRAVDTRQRPHYTATADLVDGTWTIQVHGVHGTIEERDQFSVPDAIRRHIHDTLGVQVDDISLTINFHIPEQDAP